MLPLERSQFTLHIHVHPQAELADYKDIAKLKETYFGGTEVILKINYALTKICIGGTIHSTPKLPLVIV